MAGPDDAVDREYEELLIAKDVADRLGDLLSYEVFAPAHRLFGEGAPAWVASVLRATASMIEHLPADLLEYPPDDRP